MLCHPQPILGLVTIVVPFFNRQELLSQTIQSILLQRYSKIQLILVDDGSTDDSSSVAQSFSDPRIQCIRLEKCRGKSAAINRALALVRGEWLTFFDSDDLMTADSLELRIRFLKQHSQTLSVMGRIGRLINEHGDQLSSTHSVSRDFRRKLQVTRRMASTLKGLVPELFVFGEFPLSPLSVTLFRREAIERNGILNERLTFAQDREYLMRLAAYEPIPFLDRPVMSYRVHNQNLTIQIDERGARRRHPISSLLEKQLLKSLYAKLVG